MTNDSLQSQGFHLRLARLVRSSHSFHRVKNVKKLILVSCLALAGVSMSASAAELTGGYIRGEFGNSDIDVGGASDDDNALGLGAGWFFNKNFAVEGNWTNLYDADGVELSGFGLGLVGKTTVADGKGFYANGRIGMF